jgi:hypothetical protein
MDELYKKLVIFINYITVFVLFLTDQTRENWTVMQSLGLRIVIKKCCDI